MSYEEIIGELRTAQRHTAGALWACRMESNSAAHKVAAASLEKVHTELAQTIFRLAQEDENGAQLEDLELSVRTYHILKRAGIDTIEQLVKKSPEEVAVIRGMGRRSYEEIENALQTIGMQLGGQG